MSEERPKYACASKKCGWKGDDAQLSGAVSEEDYTDERQARLAGEQIIPFCPKCGTSCRTVEYAIAHNTQFMAPGYDKAGGYTGVIITISMGTYEEDLGVVAGLAEKYMRDTKDLAVLADEMIVKRWEAALVHESDNRLVKVIARPGVIKASHTEGDEFEVYTLDVEPAAEGV